MSTGVQGAEAQPHETQVEWAEERPWEAAADPGAWPGNIEEEAPERGIGARIFAVLLILLALGWIGASGYALSQAWPGPSLSAWIGWSATVSAPLILIGLADEALKGAPGDPVILRRIAAALDDFAQA